MDQLESCRTGEADPFDETVPKLLCAQNWLKSQYEGKHDLYLL